MTTTKSTGGRWFEDFAPGMRMRHATPRTIHGGDLSTYIALTGDRRPLHSSTEFAQSLGYAREVVHELLAFHIVFGKTVPDVSLNAIANLGYADVRFLRPVYPGDTLRAETEVIGVRETSDRKSGVVTVTTRGLNQKEREVLRFTRWVLVPRRDPAAAAPPAHVPALPAAVAADELPVPAELKLQRFSDLAWATGGRALWDDYAVGERVHHVDGMTIEEADHALATRLYQNTARVHFNQHVMASSRFGRRLVYGGHVISVAHALMFNGFENALTIAAWNAGTHANPVFAGDTIYAWSDILARAPVAGRDDLGALRVRLVAVKNADPSREQVELQVAGEGGKLRHDERVVLDLDLWLLIPRG